MKCAAPPAASTRPCVLSQSSTRPYLAMQQQQGQESMRSGPLPQAFLRNAVLQASNVVLSCSFGTGFRVLASVRYKTFLTSLHSG